MTPVKILLMNCITVSKFLFICVLRYSFPEPVWPCRDKTCCCPLLWCWDTHHTEQSIYFCWSLSLASESFSAQRSWQP